MLKLKGNSDPLWRRRILKTIISICFFSCFNYTLKSWSNVVTRNKPQADTQYTLSVLAIMGSCKAYVKTKCTNTFQTVIQEALFTYHILTSFQIRKQCLQLKFIRNQVLFRYFNFRVVVFVVMESLCYCPIGVIVQCFSHCGKCLVKANS